MEIEGYEIDDLFDSEDLESIERKIDFERLLTTLSERDRKIAVLYALMGCVIDKPKLARYAFVCLIASSAAALVPVLISISV